MERLNSAFGDGAPCKAKIYNCFAEFQRGRSYLSDEFHEGRLITATTPENIDAVSNLILPDRHLTYREIASTLGMV